MKDYGSLSAFMEEAFREGGHYDRLATQMGWREAHRPHQLAYARHIGNALSRENIAVNEVMWPTIGLIQADTGIGKTRVLLTAAAFLSMKRDLPVVMSTFTRALQHQMLNGKDWKIVQALFQSLFHYSPKMAVRFGRGNFIAGSLVRSWEEERIKRGAESNPEWDALVNYLANVKHPLDATIATFSEKNGDQLPVIPHGNGYRLVDSDIALRSKHGDDDQAFYKAHLANVVDHPDIVLTNHHSIVLDALLDGKLLLPHPDERAALIVDEADHLHSVARSVLGKRVRVSQQMRHAAKTISKSLKSQMDLPEDKIKSANGMMKQLIERADFMDETLRDAGEAFEWQDVAITSKIMAANADLAECVRMPQTAVTLIRGFLKDYAGQDHHRSALEDVLDELNSVTLKGVAQQGTDGVDNADAANDVLRFISWSPTRHFAAFCVERISAHWLVFKTCGRAFTYENEQKDGTTTTATYGVREKSSNPCVLTSATLVSPFLTNLEHYRRENQFPAVVADTQEIVDVARFGKVSFVLPAPGINGVWLPKTEESDALKYNPEWTAMVSSVLRYLLNKKRRTLVLSPSFAEVSMFGGLLSDADGAAFHEDGAFRDYWATFLTGDQNMVVTPSAWEGFNPVEDGVTWCQDVVITRVPVARQDTLVDDALARVMVQANAAWVADVKKSGQMRVNDLRPLTISTAKYRLQQQRIASAYRRLVQGMGRGVRDANDRCRIWILDPRMPLGEEAMEAMEHSENPDILDLVEKIVGPTNNFAAIRAALPPRMDASYSAHSMWVGDAVVDVCAEALEGVV